jgi:DNA (cytosine-5)-methyltransferase 1
MKCVSLYSGAGGLDLGLEAAGFEIVASIEQDPDCCATLKKNGRLHVVEDDVSKVNFCELAEPGSVALLAGGPPCQPFSKSALWTNSGVRGTADPRTDTIYQYVRALRELRPRAFLLENVEGFAKWGGLTLLSEYLTELHAIGLRYRLSVSVLDAGDFGVPQKRRRFFVVGVLDEQTFEFPTPSHKGVALRKTAWDAFASLRKNMFEENLSVKGRWAGLLASIPPGKNYLWHTSRGGGLPIFGWRTRFWSFLYKLDPNKPSPTIVATPSQNSGPFHWDNRLLSTPELAALQTFPRSYKFCGSRPSRQKQIGNAVPPLLAEKIARKIIGHLGGESGRAVRFALPKAKGLPKVAGVIRVPREYRKHIGTHAEHPGTGRGPNPRHRVTPPSEEQSSPSAAKLRSSR